MAKFKRFYSSGEYGSVATIAYFLGFYSVVNPSLGYIYLSNTPPPSNADSLGDITLIDLTYFKKASGGDPTYKVYTNPLTLTSPFTSSLVTYIQADGSPATAGSIQVIANGGTVGPFRYIIYGMRRQSNTYLSPSNQLVAYFDYGFSRSLANGQTMTLSFPSNIMYTIQ
jgi:hypothetical protein